MTMPPTLEETYHPGTALDLCSWQPPTPPTNTDYIYENPPPATELGERYNKSIAERVALPAARPAVSITLEKRFCSSTRRVPHVWSARVGDSSSHSTGATTTPTTYPQLLVAKIYDPVSFDDDETQYYDPFFVRDITIACEAEAYKRLGMLQGTKVPRFYGNFAAALPAQHYRTVYVLLLEHVPGRDLRVIVPPDVTESVCAKHKDAIVDAALCLFFDILACGVKQQDMHSRNVFLRPQKQVSLSASRTQFCDTKECLLELEVDCDDLHMVMVDFEMVGFEEPDASFSEQVAQRAHIDKAKSRYLQRWLENGLV